MVGFGISYKQTQEAARANARAGSLQQPQAELKHDLRRGALLLEQGAHDVHVFVHMGIEQEIPPA